MVSSFFNRTQLLTLWMRPRLSGCVCVCVCVCVSASVWMRLRFCGCVCVAASAFLWLRLRLCVCVFTSLCLSLFICVSGVASLYLGQCLVLQLISFNQKYFLNRYHSHQLGRLATMNRCSRILCVFTISTIHSPCSLFILILGQTTSNLILIPINLSIF